ncbi:MAG: 1-deoxy-D-xylulose-5-phosphate reductoisomerase [Pseudomonadota bacterium]
MLGATGSIGRSTIDVVRSHGGAERYEVTALTAHSNAEALAEAARTLRAARAVVADEAAYPALKAALAGSGVEAAAGAAAAAEAAVGAEWVMAAVVGAAGLPSVLAAARSGADLALANKEALVCAGDLMLEAMAEGGGALLPVDSEHNAIFQCLEQDQTQAVERLILTASGGPFRDWPLERMAAARPEEALRHPNWSMGAKISIDSATMANKGLELIEAARLFRMGPERLEVVVHPQSVVHSLVGYADGSVLAQLGAPDMRTPIAYALGWPRRVASPAPRLDLAAIGRLDFEAPDERRFPALRLAREALSAGGAAPLVFNAANEVAVAAFLAGAVSFLQIAEIIERSLEASDLTAPSDLAAVFSADEAARAAAKGLIAA